jgi:hypothetical protein
MESMREMNAQRVTMAILPWKASSDRFFPHLRGYMEEQPLSVAFFPKFPHTLGALLVNYLST